MCCVCLFVFFINIFDADIIVNKMLSVSIYIYIYIAFIEDDFQIAYLKTY